MQAGENKKEAEKERKETVNRYTDKKEGMQKRKRQLQTKRQIFLPENKQKVRNKKGKQ